jgi:hypothetical protein
MAGNGTYHNGNGNGNGANGNGERPRLTGLQRAFVDAYMGDARFNATEAAARAGYQGDRVTLASVGSENLRKPQIMAEIERRWSAHGVTPSEVAARFAGWMRFDPAVLFTADGRLDWDKVRQHGENIKRITWDKGNKLSVEVIDQMKAAENLARTLGMFREVQQQEHTGEVVIRFAKPADFPE